MAPSAGQMAAVAGSEGAWLAPANRPLNGILALQPALDVQAWRRLVPAHVNVLLNDPRGFLARSEDTLGGERALGRIHVRRLMILLRRLALREGERFVFEPNSRTLRVRIRHTFERVLDELFRRGAFDGADAGAAFRVVTDDTVNPARHGRTRTAPRRAARRAGGGAGVSHGPPDHRRAERARDRGILTVHPFTTFNFRIAITYGDLAASGLLRRIRRVRRPGDDDRAEDDPRGRQQPPADSPGRPGQLRAAHAQARHDRRLRPVGMVRVGAEDRRPRLARHHRDRHPVARRLSRMRASIRSSSPSRAACPSRSRRQG